ncbi:asparaginase [Bacillus sp. JJ1566]|uniref:asparaginase n=1 Tax=Bacillus sp. JJ1566 TaxID=3122961 RepID=UPI0030007CA5
MREKIILFSLGGTIASTSLSGSGIGVKPRLTASNLVESIPQLKEVCDISTETFRQLPSVDLTIWDLIELSSKIKLRIAEGYKGVVITQGTDNIEETSFILDCLLDVEAPIVITGAMRNAELPSADGPGNVLAAVQTAVSDTSRGMGTMVVFNDEIHAAQFVKKTHTSSTATFRSSLVGPIGWISEGKPAIVLKPRKHWKITLPKDTTTCPVALIKLGFGDDDTLLELVETANYKGVVIESMGGGHVPSSMVETLERIAKSKPVVLTSRTGSGEILRHTYNFKGSESDLLGRGLIRAGMLDGLKARLLLILLLMQGANNEEIRAAFNVE